ncbi:MAG: cysteine desulfurase [Clostridia bacterium]|nr:cysteine desulfurase [Clostridia bacterium]
MICYLDNSATTRPRESVVGAMNACMLEGFYNPSALYAPAVRVEKQLTACREVVAAELRADAKRVVFTSGGTEADNLAILSLLSDRRGGRVLFTVGEHPAVRVPCEYLRGHGFDVREIPYDAAGVVRLDALEELLTPDTRMICVMQVNNETGAVMPLREIAALRDKHCPQALFHVDGVQGFLRMPVDMRALGIDSYALSGHKIHGPKGIGALVYGERARIVPRALGGGQEKNLRSGTENVPGILGLMEAVAAYPRDNAMQAVKMRLYERLRAIAGENFYVNGPLPDSAAAAPHILNCSLVPVRSETMIYALEADQVYVAAGSACSSHKQKVSTVLSAMQVPRRVAESALRFSLSPFTTAEEIDYAAECIAKHYELLKRYERR